MRVLPLLAMTFVAAALVWALVAGPPWLQGLAAGLFIALLLALLDPRNWPRPTLVAQVPERGARAGLEPSDLVAAPTVMPAIVKALGEGGSASQLSDEQVAGIHEAAAQLYRSGDLDPADMMAVTRWCYLRGREDLPSDVDVLLKLSTAMIAVP